MRKQAANVPTFCASVHFYIYYCTTKKISCQHNNLIYYVNKNFFVCTLVLRMFFSPCAEAAVLCGERTDQTAKNQKIAPNP